MARVALGLFDKLASLGKRAEAPAMHTPPVNHDVDRKPDTGRGALGDDTAFADPLTRCELAEGIAVEVRGTECHRSFRLRRLSQGRPCGPLRRIETRVQIV